MIYHVIIIIIIIITFLKFFFLVLPAMLVDASVIHKWYSYPILIITDDIYLLLMKFRGCEC